MEDIYTIRVRTRPSPADLYPSERRYSASTIGGIGVVHIALGITAALLAALTLVAKNDQIRPRPPPNHLDTLPAHFTLQDLQNPEIARNLEIFSRTNIYMKREENTTTTEDVITHREDVRISQPVSISPVFTVAPSVMSLSAFLAGITALLAWRRWYIDHNIRLFLIAAVITTLVSSICCVAILWAISNIVDFKFSEYYLSNPDGYVLHSENGIEVLRPVHQSEFENEDFYERKARSLRVVLALNIAIATVLELVWSMLSTRIAWRGVRRNYSEDFAAPDVVPQHAKHLRKVDERTGAHYLPKNESHKEFQERVHKFLAEEVV